MQQSIEQSMEKQDSLYKETENIRVKAFNYYESLCKQCEKSPDLASNLIKTLINVIKESKETTFQGLTYNLRVVADYIIHQARDTGLLGTRTILTLKSVSSIFTHYVNKGLRTQVGNDIQQMHKNLIKISEDLLEITMQAKHKVKQYSFEFFQNGTTILVYGYSTSVADILIHGANKGVKFQVIVCESRPTCEGYKMVQQLEKENIECKLIIDSALGTAIEEADMVLTGAEAVVENGGIINKIGTFTVALCSKCLRKPFYVVSESFKFTREFPLSQSDLPEDLKQTGHCDLLPSATKNLSKEEQSNLTAKFSHPTCDYTPPEYITLLFTDVGIFTPSAVSDELIQIFNT